MSYEIELPKNLDKIIEQYNKDKLSENIELEILFKKKINEKALKKINSYFKKKAGNSQTSYTLDISLLTEKNRRLSRINNVDILE